MFKEFKEFALKGNVVDLAVGVIIGGAFGKIVTSLVNDILMPVLSVLIGGFNFSELKFIITPASEGVAEVAFKYGAFAQSVLDFLIISFSIFMLARLLSSFKKKQSKPEPAPEKPTKEEILLAEIRDLLKEKQA
mgnify:CR=1 FL=1